MNARGFTYLSLLFGIALLGIGLAATGVVWTTEARLSQERELRFIGEQFRQAIGSYYEATPGNLKKYPPSLADLLQDDRYLFMRRHLRKIYLDPVTKTPQWELIAAPDGGVMGVYSRTPRYQSWKFAYVPS